MSPETGTIFTTVVNLELSDEQRANTDPDDILRETKKIFVATLTEKRRGKCINSRCSPRRSESVRRGVEEKCFPSGGNRIIGRKEDITAERRIDHTEIVVDQHQE